ncbi:MAG: class F sortase [Candidatus Saccharimonadales bacterium]
MPGLHQATQDNQFVDDKLRVYIEGPVSRVISSSRPKIDNVLTGNELTIKPSRLKHPLSSPGYFQQLLLNSGPVKLKPRRFTRVQILLLSIAAVALIAGGYYSYIGIRSVKLSKLQAANLTNIVNHSRNPNTGGSGLSTAKITASTLASYTVAANLPRYLFIPKLNVDARVLAVGLTANNAVGTPNDVYDTAWYDGSSQPGQNGAILIDGHISSWTTHGVFFGLSKLVKGDEVKLERGDSTMFTYQVVRSQIYPANSVDMKAALSPVSGNQGLNLITCAGEVIPGTSSYSDRLVVFTTRVN